MACYNGRMASKATRMTIDECAKLRAMYDAGASINDLAQKHGRSPWTVHNWLRNNGGCRTIAEGNALVRSRTPTDKPRADSAKALDVKAFRRLTPELAWVLGLLFGDGNIKSTGRIQIAIGPDKDIAEKVAAILLADARIYNVRNCWHVEWYSVPMTRDLAHLGVLPAKTYTMMFPVLHGDLVPHFVRGLWDSDGSWGTHDDRLVGDYSSASPCFANTLAVVIAMCCGAVSQVCVSDPAVRPNSIAKALAYKLSYNAARCVALAKWIYADSRAHMCGERKRSIVQMAIT